MTDDSKNADASGSWKTSVAKDGSYQRKESKFRNWITADGSSGFKAEAGRYHLYISYACPWACRTLMVRKLKGLDHVIGFTAVDWLLAEGGWRFTADKAGCSLDPLHTPSPTFLREVYLMADPEYHGNITVPVLFDRVTNTIVNNESSEIIQMLNSQFNALSATPEQAALDLYPEPLKKEVDEVNDWVYHTINNGVYKCGFATAQEPYETAFHALFASLDRVEAILSRQRYLCGSQLTLADVRLFTTLVRFDAVYVTHFKCNLRRLTEYPSILAYTRELYQLPGVKETVNLEHIKKHYFMSHRSINPHGVVPIGLQIDFDAPHGREAAFPFPAKQ